MTECISSKHYSMHLSVIYVYLKVLFKMYTYKLKKLKIKVSRESTHNLFSIAWSFMIPAFLKVTGYIFLGTKIWKILKKCS